MSLYTGQRINNFEYKELPITDELIERVEELVELENQPVLTCGVPTFEWTPAVEIEDLDDDENENNQQENNEDAEVNTQNNEEKIQKIKNEKMNQKKSL